MGRAKFSLTDHIDQKNFMAYIDRNEENLISDLRSNSRELGKDSLDSVNEFRSMLEYLRSPSFILNTEFDERYVFYDKLLYMLPKETIVRIKTSLRAMRNRSHSKKQVTVDEDAHAALKEFARSRDLTLSDAIALLCDLQRILDMSLDDIRSIYNITKEEGEVKSSVGVFTGSGACAYRMGKIASIAERALDIYGAFKKF